MINSKLPNNSVVTGKTALAFYNYILDDMDKNFLAMKSGTNINAYKNKYYVSIQKEATLSVGVIRKHNLKIYSIERLFIELELFDLKEQFEKVNEILSRDVNLSIVEEIKRKLKGKRRGINWKRIDDTLKNKKVNDKALLLNRMIKEIVYETSKVEIPTLTFIDTEKVIEDLPTGNLKSSEVEIILSLKKAFEELISYNALFSLKFFKAINYRISQGKEIMAGQIRDNNIRIGGTDYIPPIPTEEFVESFIKEINEIVDIPLRVATFIAKATKLQFFYDGNKRTALVCGNKILMDNQYGLVSIPGKYRPVYLTLLKNYYENDERLSDLIDFIKLCIFEDQNHQIEQHKKMESWIKNKTNVL